MSTWDFTRTQLMKGYEKENLKLRFFDSFEICYNYNLTNTDRLFICSKILSLVDQGRNNFLIIFFTKRYIQRIKIDHFIWTSRLYINSRKSIIYKSTELNERNRFSIVTDFRVNWINFFFIRDTIWRRKTGLFMNWKNYWFLKP